MIVHVDPAFVIAEKPPGLPTVPGRPVELHDCLWHRVRELHADALVVHRLDMGTSGLVVFARGIEAQRTLSRAFEQRLVGKTYVALASGEPVTGEGSLASDTSSIGAEPAPAPSKASPGVASRLGSSGGSADSSAAGASRWAPPDLGFSDARIVVMRVGPSVGAVGAGLGFGKGKARAAGERAPRRTCNVGRKPTLMRALGTGAGANIGAKRLAVSSSPAAAASDNPKGDPAAW